MSSNNFDIEIHQQLEDRKRKGLLRSLPLSTGLIDFCSNDYLGFSHNQSLKEKLSSPSLNNGATGSRLISGNSFLAEEAERTIAEHHKTESALIFNNGYMANLGLFTCLGSKNTVFIYDEYIHASAIDGMRLSLAKRVKFRHNNLENLEKKLKKSTEEKKIVAIESLYSMEGDLAPLKEIAGLCSSYNALLIVDEAHATGIYGEKGEGLVSALNLEEQVYARVHTFGKALGLHGAAIVCNSLFRNYLINYSRSFIYTTALPPYLYEQLLQAYSLLTSSREKEKLFTIISYFNEQVIAQAFTNISIHANNSPIQSIFVNGNENATRLSNDLTGKGFFVKAILSPTIPVGMERIRICLHSFNTTKEIDELIVSLKDYSQ